LVHGRRVLTCCRVCSGTGTASGGTEQWGSNLLSSAAAGKESAGGGVGATTPGGLGFMQLLKRATRRRGGNHSYPVTPDQSPGTPSPPPPATAYLWLVTDRYIRMDLFSDFFYISLLFSDIIINVISHINHNSHHPHHQQIHSSYP
jgi:hypothetical protein